jgi:MATE family multidrug resistance protein
MNDYKRLIKLSLPVLITYLSFHLIGITDMIMVGRLGKEAIASVGLAITVWIIIFLPLEFFFETVTILLSRAFGKGDRKLFKKYFYTEVIIAVLIGFVAIFLYFPLNLILGLLTKDEVVLKIASSYLFLAMLRSIPFTLAQVFSRTFIAIQRPKYVTYISLVVTALNIFLNYILIFGNFGFPRLEVVGAGIASLIASIFQAILLYLFIKRKIKPFINDDKFTLSKPIVKEIFRIGIPLAEVSFIESIAWVTFIRFISHLGVAPYASHEIAMKVKDIGFFMGYSIATVCGSLVGESMGKNDETRAKKFTNKSIVLAVVSMALFGITFFTIPDFFTSLFTRDLEVIEISRNILRVMALYQIADAIYLVFRSSLNAMKDTKFVRNIGFIGLWGLMIPSTFILVNVFKIGVIGAWIGLTFYVVFAAVVFWIRFTRKNWSKDSLELN